ncbi:MAG TPA: 30S ribosomal protein S2 [Candidatus Marinimicrobia bacterium]|nr:30S ribosomal protein S2 [Candidatus Neomarinimicrobiota bacterium]
MEKITLEVLLSTGAHFGHLTSKWNPAMKDYIFMEKNGIHIIDLNKTLVAIEKAAEFMAGIIREGGEILMVGTKKQARSIIKDEAERAKMHYITERWLGGTLTNFITIKRSIRRMQQLQKESESENAWTNLTKKEILGLLREKEKLEILHQGIKDMKKIPDCLYIIDADYEATAIQEALRLDIPIVAIVDTNADPSLVDVPIPANDDSYRTIQMITQYLADTVINTRGFNKDRRFEDDPAFEEKMASEHKEN